MLIVYKWNEMFCIYHSRQDFVFGANLINIVYVKKYRSYLMLIVNQLFDFRIKYLKQRQVSLDKTPINTTKNEFKKKVNYIYR